MGLDRYGIAKLFPTKTNGLEWFNEWKNGKSRTLNEGDNDPYDSKFMYTCGSPNIPLKIDGKGYAYTTALTTSARLFVTGPWLNTEITIYAKGDLGLADIQLRSRSNHEQSCGFGNYVVKWNRFENGAFVNQVSTEVEPLHSFYSRHHDENSIEKTSLSKWYGYKQITRTVNGNTVKVEGYRNKSISERGRTSYWKKETEFTFNGTNITNIVVAPDDPRTIECTGVGDNIPPDYNAHTLFLNPGQWCWIRANGSDHTRFKYFSVREINPI